MAVCLVSGFSQEVKSEKEERKAVEGSCELGSGEEYRHMQRDFKRRNFEGINPVSIGTSIQLMCFI